MKVSVGITVFRAAGSYPVKMPTKVRYAVRTAVELAGREAGQPVPVKVLAEAQGLSPKYVKQLANRLRSAGIVKGYPGVSGGFRLARKPSEITVLDIYTAMDGGLGLVPCLTQGKRQPLCARRGICSVADFWHDLTGDLEKRMGSVTIEELASHARDLRRAGRRAPKPRSVRPPRGKE